MMSEKFMKTGNNLTQKRLYNITMKYIFLVLFIFFFALAGNSTINAQNADYPVDAVPPPLKIISKAEINQLKAEPKMKNRTKLSLELMDIRLVNAEKFAGNKNYVEMFNELGKFHALVDNAIDYLDKNDNGGGKVLDNFKRFELGLRKFLPKLELIRRELPAKYEYYVRGLAKQVRDARSRCVEPMFDDSVVSNN